MTVLARSALCCALALAVLSVSGGAAAARTSAQPSPSPQALLLPADLSNVCEADSQALQLAMTQHWRPSLNALDQWTQLVRSFACDLSGSRDLGWHRVPLRAYESAIRYPLTWVETEMRNGRRAASCAPTTRPRSCRRRSISGWAGASTRSATTSGCAASRHAFQPRAPARRQQRRGQLRRRDAMRVHHASIPATERPLAALRCRT